MSKKVSVICIIRNDRDYFSLIKENFLKLDYPEEDLELLVLDDGPENMMEDFLDWDRTLYVHMSQEDGKDIDQSWVALDEASRDINDRNLLVAMLLNELFKLIKIFPKEGFKAFKSEFESLDLLNGKVCKVTSDDTGKVVEVIGVSDSGELLVKENSGFVSISEQSSKVVGFVIMTKKDISLFRCLTFKSFFFLIKKILLNFRYFKAFTISFFKLYLQRSSLKNYDMSAVELSHIAVKKDFKSQKIGTNLIKRFEDQAKKDGYKKIFTSSHNEKLVEHYKKIKDAEVLSIIDLGTYKSYNVIWNIK